MMRPTPAPDVGPNAGALPVVVGREPQVDAARVAGWIGEVTPKAIELVNWMGPVVDASVTVRARPTRDFSLAPYGPFMLSWFEGHRPDPMIHYLTDYRIYFALCHWCFRGFGIDSMVASRALSNLTRLRIAVTNDVLQVMSPTAPGRYSMIRHHALMLFTATRWLSSRQRSTWLAVYTQAAAALCRQGVAGGGDLRECLDRVEDDAMEAFAEYRSSASDLAAARRLFQSSDAGMRRIADYLLYTHAAVWLVDERYRRALASGWSERSWVAAEICRYRSDGYLLEEFARFRVPGQPRGRGAGDGSG